MDILRSDLTGWGAFGSLALTVILGFWFERVVSRRSFDRQLRERDEQIARALADRDAQMIRALAERDDRITFYRDAHKIERDRNDVLTGGMFAMMTEIRNAVTAPGRAAS